MSENTDAAARTEKAVDENGFVILREYDVQDRLIRDTASFGEISAITTYRYSADGRSVTSTDDQGVETLTEFDEQARVIRETRAGHLVAAFTYWPNGKVATHAVYDWLDDGTKGELLTEYDEQGGITSTPDGRRF